MKKTQVLFECRNDKKLLLRFESKLTKQENGCWHLQTHHDKDGYPLMWFLDNNIRGSQLAITLYKQLNCTDSVVCHTCDNCACVNPEHLVLADNKSNTRDMLSRNRGGLQKITEQHVREIYRKSLQGERNLDLALQYGISAATICNILKGRNWDWLYGEYLAMKSQI